MMAVEVRVEGRGGGMTACAWCGTSDQAVASSITADGHRWPPMCARCSARVRRDSLRAPRGREIAPDAAEAPEAGDNGTLWTGARP